MISCVGLLARPALMAGVALTITLPDHEAHALAVIMAS